MHWPCAMWVLSLFLSSFEKAARPFFTRNPPEKNGRWMNARRIILLFYLPTLFECKHVRASPPEHRHAINQINYWHSLHTRSAAHAAARKAERAFYAASALGVFVCCAPPARKRLYFPLCFFDIIPKQNLSQYSRMMKSHF